MTEPRRLLDTATGLDRRILESVVDDEPSPARRRRVVAAIGAASVGVGSAAAALKVVEAAARWKIVVGIATMAGVGVGAVAALQASRASAPPIVTAASTLVVPSASAFAPVAAADPVSLPVPPQTSASAPVAKKPARALPTATSSTPPVAPSISIAGEIALIDRVRSSLAAGSPQSALATLDEYDIECRSGALSLEAAVLRVEALAAAGDTEGAATRAKRFLVEHPRSAYEARVRAHLSKP
jgi:hypothetical protein